MPNEKDWEEKLIYGKKQELTRGKVTRGEVVGDRTIINLKAFSKEYKLETNKASNIFRLYKATQKINQNAIYS